MEALHGRVLMVEAVNPAMTICHRHGMRFMCGSVNQLAAPALQEAQGVGGIGCCEVVRGGGITLLI
jgi:hypothetical protein